MSKNHLAEQGHAGLKYGIAGLRRAFPNSSLAVSWGRKQFFLSQSLSDI
jgi:hypothetical protein